MSERPDGADRHDPAEAVIVAFAAVLTGAGGLAAVGSVRLNRELAGLPFSPWLWLLPYSVALAAFFRLERRWKRFGRLRRWQITTGCAAIGLGGVVVPLVLGLLMPLTVLPSLQPRAAALVLWTRDLFFVAVFAWRRWQLRRRFGGDP